MEVGKNFFAASSVKKMSQFEEVSPKEIKRIVDNLLKQLFFSDLPDIKQLLDEVEHDIMNYQSRGLCYLPKPKAEADNTDTRV